MMQIQKAKQGYKLVKSFFGKYEEIPEEWEFRKLSNLAEKDNDIVAGPFGSNLKVSDYKSSGVPIIRLQNIERSQFKDKNIKYVSKKKAEELSYHSYQPNDLILAKLGDPIGKTCRIPENFSSGIVVADVVRIRTSSNKADSKYVEYVLNSNICGKQYDKERMGTTRPRVNLEQIRDLRFPCPPLWEQKKISSILSNIDSLVQLTRKEIEQTQRFNKGVTQKLLTKGIGHNKFKKTKFLFGKIEEFPENWDVLRFDEFISFKSGSTPRRENPEYFHGKIPWITSTDLNRGEITNTLEKITEDAVQKTRLKIFPKGTFVIALYGLEAAGTRGKCGILGINAAVNQACMVLNPSEKVDPKYLFYYYLNFGEKIVFNVAQGTKQQNLSEDVLKFIKMPIPPITEQKIIVQILVNADSKIQFQQQYKSNLENLKKGLMQKLLTGQIRVKV